MRFLFVTVPVSGHVSPALPIARQLVGRGHEVRWYTSSRFQDNIEATGARFIPFQAARDIDYHNINELFPERTKLKGLAQGKWDLKRLVIDVAVEQCGDVSDILRAFPADVILGDTFAFSAQFIAEKMGLPFALLNVMNLFVRSQDTAPDGLALAPSTTQFGRLRNRFLNWFVLRIILRDINHYFNQARAKQGLPPVPDSLFEFPVRQSQVFLQPTIPAFEYPRRDLPDHVHFIGPLLPDAQTDFTPPAWWDDLRAERPVVLVTQGTIATTPDELLTPAICGLASEDVLVVATLGNQSAESVKPHPLPANVRLEPFIPFAHIMPYIDVMVTNGGYGGIHFALAHGVPLVASGQSEDKAEICARVAWAGVGINLKTSAPTPEQVREAVKRILKDLQYKQKAQAIQAEFARHNAAMEAAELLEELARPTP